MRYFLIAVEKTLDGKQAVICDLTYTISQSPQNWLTWNGQDLIEVAGKHATVYIIDTYDDFERHQHIRLAEVFVKGLYDVYSYITGETTRGKPKMETDNNA